MKRFLTDEAGAAGVEYGILVAAISAAIVALAFTLGGYVTDAFQTVVDAFEAEGFEDAGAADPA